MNGADIGRTTALAVSKATTPVSIFAMATERRTISSQSLVKPHRRKTTMRKDDRYDETDKPKPIGQILLLIFALGVLVVLGVLHWM
jgi:hypothetical protein